MEEKSLEMNMLEAQTVSDLKRKLKTQTMQFTNERLLLEHKNELLRQELIELKEREINQTKLHESMFNKGNLSYLSHLVMSQSSADPNEFISRQLEVIKEINAKELNELKSEIIDKNKRIKDLTEQLTNTHDRLNRTDNEFVHKSKDMELKIRELELQNKMLEEDRDRIECENTLLVEELLATEKNHESHDTNKISEEQVYLNNDDGDVPNEIQDIRIIELEDQIHATLVENDNAKKLINKLKTKSKKLKENLQKSETINQHNIVLLQTQFEKEQNQWEKERFNLQQEILALKKQNMSQQHLIKKYQYNEQISNNTSCWNCSRSSTNDPRVNPFRTPFAVINQCGACAHKTYDNYCSFSYSKSYPQQCTCNIGCKDKSYLNEYDYPRCESQNCMCLNSERSENEFINPLLTQDSRQPHNKILSQHCDNSRKGSRNSYNKRTSCNHNDSHSLIVDRNEALKSKIMMNSSYNNGVSELNPVCDSDSQQIDSNDYRKTRNLNMQHSKTFTNILKNSKFSLNKDNNCWNLQQHLENFNNRSNSRQKSGVELIKESSKEYNSSIHQCKPTLSHGIYIPPRQLTEDCENFEIKEDIDNVITNESESENSKFSGMNPNKGAFGPPSNLSAVPVHHEEEISSSDELAVNMMNKNYKKSNHANSYKQLPYAQRYNKSFVKNGLKVDTSPNALLLKDICEATHTTKYSKITENRMLRMMRNGSGCQSTKNLNSTAFAKPKRTVSINLFMNESEGDHKSSESRNSNFESGKDSIKYNNPNKLSTVRKQAKLGITSRNTYINETLKQAYSKFGNRKNTMEENSSLANLSKQLEKTEQALNNVSRKQSQQMINIQDKIRIIKEQLDSHKKQEVQHIVSNTVATPTTDSRFKKKNMSKYIQSKTRNNMCEIPESKTAEKVYSKKDQRPMSSIMMNTVKTHISRPIPSDRNTMDSNMVKYVKMSCKNATQNFGSLSSGKNHMSYADTDQSDRTTQKQHDYSNSSHVVTLSECHDEHDNIYGNKPRINNRDHLMHIQEEQEYTTNERDEVMMASSCKCETDEDQTSSNKDFIKNYCYTNKHIKLDEESEIDSEVLLSSPLSHSKPIHYKSNVHRFK